MVDRGGSVDEAIVKTGWRPRMWWLTMFRGYSIDSVHRTPNQNTFGEIYYKTNWRLSKKPK